MWRSVILSAHWFTVNMNKQYSPHCIIENALGKILKDVYFKIQFRFEAPTTSGNTSRGLKNHPVCLLSSQCVCFTHVVNSSHALCV